MKALPTFSDYSFEGPMLPEEEPVFMEFESHEERKFLVGLGNGVWMSMVLGTLAYWIVHIFADALR